MWQYNKTETLSHHGILGQKWGVRRFQNKDGTRTEAGKRRERETPSQKAKGMTDEELSKSVKRMKLERQYVQTSKEISDADKKTSALETTKKSVDITNDFVRSTKRQLDEDTRQKPKVVKEDLSKMTDKELRDKINRAALEQQYINYYGKREVSKGRQYVSQILEVAGGVSALGSSALGIALAIKQLKG